MPACEGLSSDMITAALFSLQIASDGVAEVKLPFDRVVAQTLVIKPGSVRIAELKFTSMLTDVRQIKAIFAKCKVSSDRSAGFAGAKLIQEGQYFTFHLPLGGNDQPLSRQDFSRAVGGCAIRSIEFVPGWISITVDQWQSPEMLRAAFPGQSFLQSESAEAIASKRAGNLDHDGIRFLISSSSSGVSDSATGRLSFVMLSSNQRPRK
jgi:hypothetical protein